MKAAIFYASSHGTTEKTAQMLNEKLGNKAEIINIRKTRQPDFDSYDTVIIGGSIHAGRVQSSVRKFLEKNQDALMKKKLGLFLCCMETGDGAMKQFENAYPEELRKHAGAVGLFGGEFLMDKMNFVQRAIVKKVSGQETSVSKINEEAITEFAKKIKRK